MERAKFPTDVDLTNFKIGSVIVWSFDARIEKISIAWTHKCTAFGDDPSVNGIFLTISWKLCASVFQRGAIWGAWPAWDVTFSDIVWACKIEIHSKFKGALTCYDPYVCVNVVYFPNGGEFISRLVAILCEYILDVYQDTRTVLK